MQFMEDNQATITILTAGESQSMRHTDWEVATAVPIKSVADLLTKPFTGPAKWQHAIDLIRLVDYKYQQPKTVVASPRGEGDYDMITIEFCCSKNSRLGEENRKYSKGVR